MGDTGPCGPCSEIFYDHGPGAGKIADPFQGIVAGEDRFVEIWNLVFMQFYESAPGVLQPLPKPSVDTGSGLERVVAALQGTNNNYNTDLFRPLIETACKISGADYVTDQNILSTNPKINEVTSALRVLADHSRAAGFLIADGALPSNEGRGYVLRRIMRRAIRYGRKLSDNSILPAMADSLVQSMGGTYKELQTRREHILKTIREEESRFLQTLDQGTEILSQEIQKIRSKGQKEIAGDVVFKLYDTYGFPADLTQLIAAEQGLTIDEKNFDLELDRAREKSKASWKGAGTDQVQTQMIKWVQDISGKVPATEFTGYEHVSDKTVVSALSSESASVDSLNEGDMGFIITPKTCFYAESGGQVGDIGHFTSTNATGEVLNCFKQKDYHIHHVLVKRGTLKKNEPVELVVHNQDRRNTAANHSATHLLHAALRKVLGTHVSQAGSLVDATRLRFDFTHSQPVTPAQMREIETLVNSEISKANQVKTELMAPETAIKAGAMALFGEKYGDTVRVLTMGDFSVELCGGTHVSNTSQIRMVKVVSETGVSSGVRRIEAVAGDRAVDFAFHALQEDQLARSTMGLTNPWTSFLQKEPETTLQQWVESKREEIKNLEKEIRKAKSGAIDTAGLAASAMDVNIGGQGAKLVIADLSIDDREVLSQTMDQIKAALKSGVVVCIGDGSADNYPLLIGVTSDLTSKIKAGQILKDLTAALGGKGGGRPEFAQGALTKKDPAAVRSFFSKN